MVMLQSKMCFRCKEVKHIVSEDIYCAECTNKINKEAEDAAVEMLSDLSVDERINRLERLVYKLMKSSSPFRNPY